MKKTYFIILIFTIFFPINHLFSEDESEVLDEKKIWDLLRDIKDYSKGRFNYYFGTGTAIPILETDGEDAPVRITYTDPDLDPTPIPYFGFQFPQPRNDYNLIIEIDFKWPTSQGYLRFIFDTWDEDETLDDRNQSIGVLLNYDYWTGTGIYVGDILPILKGETDSSKYSNDSLSLMGNSTHTLKIVVKQDTMYAVLDDNDILQWSGNTSPDVFVMIGGGMYPATDGGESFIISRYQVNVNMDTD